MGRCLEFASAIFVIFIINTAFTLWVGNLVANKVNQLFNQVIQALAIID